MVNLPYNKDKYKQKKGKYRQKKGRIKYKKSVSKHGKVWWSIHKVTIHSTKSKWVKIKHILLLWVQCMSMYIHSKTHNLCINLTLVIVKRNFAKLFGFQEMMFNFWSYWQHKPSQFGKFNSIPFVIELRLKNMIVKVLEIFLLSIQIMEKLFY